jgi:hypothetical protein
LLSTRQNSTVIVGVKGKSVGGVYINSVFPDEIPLPRMECLWIRLPRLVWPPASISNQRALERAAITGDFVLAPTEVNPVIHALRANGIEVTALHSHMLDEQPRWVFYALLGERRRTKTRPGVYEPRSTRWPTRSRWDANELDHLTRRAPSLPLQPA